MSYLDDEGILRRGQRGRYEQFDDAAKRLTAIRELERELRELRSRCERVESLLRMHRGGSTHCD